MTNKWNYFLLSVVAVFITIAGCKPSEEKKPVVSPVIKVSKPKNTSPPQFCPQAEELVLNGDMWQTENGNWKSFTQSSATKVQGFIGAQWMGIKVGKIICLYHTNEAVAFPLAVEHAINKPILEPSGYGWSALTGNRKFCESASVADCAYFTEAPKDITNIYKEIEYDPQRD